MQIVTAESFLEVLQKSNLLSDEQFAEARSLGEEHENAEALARALSRREMLTRWQAGQLLAGRTTFLLGKYKLMRLLGRGGMGSVFLARHITMNRPVALKIVSRKVGKDPASLQRFLSEARAIAALDHPNIVQAYSVDKEGDRYYIVMEFIEGLDLGEMVENDGPLEFSRLVNYMRQACDGLAHAHSRNMIHCDIKPSNLMVNRQGVLKVLDMGMARLGGNGDDLTESQEERILGTVDYLSPEQAMESRNLDHRSDIYSLGCTLYFLLTGRPPFPEGTLAQRLVKHQTEEPRPIAELRPDAPSDLIDICHRMMAKAPEDRFQSIEEIGALLAEWQPPEPEPQVEQPAAVPRATATRGPAAEEFDEPAGPNVEKIAWVTVAVLVVVGLVAGGVGLLAKSESEKRRAAQERRESVFGEPNVTWDFPERDSKSDEDEFVWPQPQVVQPEPEDEDPPQEPPSGDMPATDDEQPPTERPPNGKPAGDSAKPPGEKPPEKKPPEKKPPKTDPSPKTSPKEKPPKQPAAPPADKLFAGLPASVQLPSHEGAEATAPVSLGKISPPGESGWDLRLAGGATAVADGGEFRLAAAGDKEKSPGWTVQFVAQGEGAKTDVARLFVESGNLNFAWLPEAETVPAGYLRNTALRFTAGKQEFFLPLTKPQLVEPLAIDMVRGSETERLPLEWMPQRGTLQLEIVKLIGPWPKLEIKPDKVVPPGGEASVVITGPKLPEIAFEVSFPVTSRYAKIDVGAVFRMESSDSKRDLPFSRREIERLKKGRMVLMNREIYLKNQLKRVRNNETQTRAINKEIQTTKEAVEAINALDSLFQSVSSVTALQYRVVMTIEGQPVVLVETQ